MICMIGKLSVHTGHSKHIVYQSENTRGGNKLLRALERLEEAETL